MFFFEWSAVDNEMKKKKYYTIEKFTKCNNINRNIVEQGNNRYPYS